MRSRFFGCIGGWKLRSISGGCLSWATSRSTWYAYPCFTVLILDTVHQGTVHRDDFLLPLTHIATVGILASQPVRLFPAYVSRRVWFPLGGLPACLLLKCQSSQRLCTRGWCSLFKTQRLPPPPTRPQFARLLFPLHCTQVYYFLRKRNVHVLHLMSASLVTLCY
jgi:hypothetical protein